MTSPPTAAPRGRVLARSAGFVLLSVGVGCAAGLGWQRAVDLPGYLVAADGSASTSERGLTRFISGDAWFVAIGLVLGAMLGALAWWLLRGLGWPVVVVAVLAASLAAVACWSVGYYLGPGPLEPRLAAAQPGDVVPIELSLQAPSALLVWPFAATLPLLLASSLGRDEEADR